MGKVKYTPSGVCAREISFDIDGNMVRNIEFVRGCDGNGKALASLAEGMPVDQVIKKLSGIKCSHKSTSCADQLAKALKEQTGQN